MFQKLKRRLSNTILTSPTDQQLQDVNNQKQIPSIEIPPIHYEDSELSDLISMNEIQLIRETWIMLRNDLASFKFLGAEILVRYFMKYPDYQRQFKSFKDVPILSYQDQQHRRQNGEMIRINKKLMAHGTYVMYTIGMLVDNLEQPLLMEQMLKRLARNHYRRRINIVAFERLRDTLLEHLLDRMGSKTFNKHVQQAWRKAFAYLIGEIERNFHSLDSDIQRCGSYYQLNSLQRHAKHDLFQHYKTNGQLNKPNMNHIPSYSKLRNCPSFNQRQKRNDYIELRMQDPKCKLRSFRMLPENQDLFVAESSNNSKSPKYSFHNSKCHRNHPNESSKSSSMIEDEDGIWIKTKDDPLNSQDNVDFKVNQDNSIIRKKDNHKRYSNENRSNSIKEIFVHEQIQKFGQSNNSSQISNLGVQMQQNGAQKPKLVEHQPTNSFQNRKNLDKIKWIMQDNNERAIDCPTWILKDSCRKFSTSIQQPEIQRPRQQTLPPTRPESSSSIKNFDLNRQNFTRKPSANQQQNFRKGKKTEKPPSFFRRTLSSLRLSFRAKF